MKSLVKLISFIRMRSLPTKRRGGNGKGHTLWRARRQGFLTEFINIVTSKIIELTYLRRLLSVSLIVQNLVSKGISLVLTFRSTSQTRPRQILSPIKFIHHVLHDLWIFIKHRKRRVNYKTMGKGPFINEKSERQLSSTSPTGKIQRPIMMDGWINEWTWFFILLFWHQCCR